MATTELNELNRIADMISGGANGVYQWYRDAFNKKFIYSACVEEFAQRAKCYWFLTDMATVYAKKTTDGLNIVMLESKDNKAIITIYHDYDSSMSEEGNFKTYGIFKSEEIWTDLTEGNVKFYLFNETDIDGTYKLFFPSEY